MPEDKPGSLVDELLHSVDEVLGGSPPQWDGVLDPGHYEASGEYLGEGAGGHGDDRPEGSEAVAYLLGEGPVTMYQVFVPGKFLMYLYTEYIYGFSM